MSFDDFLWDCALQSQTSSRLDIIPDYEDDMRHFCADNERNADLGATFQLSTTNLPEQQEIDICITESRGNGVLDIIGGELWEGSLLLCVYILQHQQIFLRPDILELGSGVGLPGLLLAQLKSNNAKLFKGDVGKITLTDNDPRVVSNLNSSVVALPTCNALLRAELSEPYSAETKNIVTLHTRLLDWSVFSSLVDTNVDIITEPVLPEVVHEVSAMCEVIVGCELCYAPYHAQCLAQLLRYYLQKGYCQKVVICQMRDREGFQQLLATLQSMKIEFVIQEVAQKQYELAQRIRCTKANPRSTSSATANQSKSKSKISTRTEEDDDEVSKIFTFPVCLHYDASGGIEYVSDDKSSAAVDSNPPYTDNLLHTPKENFVFLIIG